MTVATLSPASAAWRLLLPGLVLVLAFLRTPLVFLQPRFWAEEADLFFAHACFVPWYEALLPAASLRSGYLSLFPAWSTWLAAHAAPLSLAPTVTLLLSALAQWVPCHLALFGPRRVLSGPAARALLTAILLWFPYASGSLETWFNTLNAMTHLGVAALLVLLDDVDRGTRAYRWGTRLWLLLGALSGPYVIALLPAFSLRAWRERTREQKLRVAILGCGLALQVLAFASAQWLGLMRDQKSAALQFARAYMAAVYQVLYSFAGELWGSRLLYTFGLPVPGMPGFDALSPASLGMVATASVALALVLVFWLLARRAPEATLVLISGAAWTVLTVLFAVNGVPGFRYAVAPATAWGILLALALFPSQSNRWLQAMLGLAMACALATGVREYFLAPDIASGRNGLASDWPADVAAWRQNPDHRLRVWPQPGYFVNLPEPGRLAALRAALPRQPVLVDASMLSQPALLVALPEGLPAYFALRFELCTRGASTPARIAFSDARIPLLQQQVVLSPGCVPVELNSMSYAFAGFHEFSQVTRIELLVPAPAGQVAIVARGFMLRSPAMTVAHPISGR